MFQLLTNTMFRRRFVTELIIPNSFRLTVKKKRFDTGFNGHYIISIYTTVHMKCIRPHRNTNHGKRQDL